MSIFTGDLITSVHQAAMAYFGQHLSIIPLIGKKPAIPSWAMYQQEPAGIQDINWWASNGKLQNVGIVCGEVSQNLIVMDLDGQRAVEVFRANFPELLDTFTVATGSGRGQHVYLRVFELPPTRRFLQPDHSAIELRSSGTYVAAPPSIHPDTGQRYIVSNAKPILVVPNLKRLTTWLDAVIEANKPRRPARPAGGSPSAYPNVQTPAGIKNPTGWTNAAVNKEMQAVKSAPAGTRNNRLNTAAYNLGQIVGIGWLTAATAESSLLAAADAAGLPEGESLRTIRSGLQRGIEQRRDLQWRKRSPR